MVEYEGRTSSELVPINQTTQHPMPEGGFQILIMPTGQQILLMMEWKLAGEDVSVLCLTNEDTSVYYKHL
jgi:hypothetical protein